MKNDDGTLKGKYICKYTDDKNKWFETEISTDWTEQNFLVFVLAYVQQKAYEIKQPIEVANTEGQITPIHRYVSVENENVTFEIKNHQIHMLKYKHGHTIPSKTEFQKDEFGNFLLDKNKKKIPIV